METTQEKIANFEFGILAGITLNALPALAAFINVDRGVSNREHTLIEFLGVIAGVALTLAVIAVLSSGSVGWVLGGATVAVIALALDWGGTLSSKYPQAK